MLIGWDPPEDSQPRRDPTATPPLPIRNHIANTPAGSSPKMNFSLGKSQGADHFAVVGESPSAVGKDVLASSSNVVSSTNMSGDVSSSSKRDSGKWSSGTGSSAILAAAAAGAHRQNSGCHASATSSRDALATLISQSPHQGSAE